MKYLLIIIAIMLCGCTTWKWEHPNEKKNKKPQIWPESYNYYVIDPNSDTPDAYFINLNEATTYKKEFAENHDYVIVKMDSKYNVYNVELDN
tara:strand:- start:414 stop:689 length:276 start_codon:yes stop_codon:yes gene_type:complete